MLPRQSTLVCLTLSLLKTPYEKELSPNIRGLSDIKLAHPITECNIPACFLNLLDFSLTLFIFPASSIRTPS